MTLGFRLWGANGQLQGSSDAKQFVFKAKGTQSMQTNGYSTAVGGGCRFDLPGGLSNPVIALRPQAAGVWVAVAYRTTDNASFYLLCTSATALIDWWLFDVPGPPTENYGINVRNAAGAITFHSFAHPMKVVGVGQQISLSVPGGRTYAIIQGSLSGDQGWVQDRTGPTGDNARYFKAYYWNAAGRTGDGSIATSEQLLDRTTTGAITNPPAGIQYGPANFLAVDVTGL